MEFLSCPIKMDACVREFVVMPYVYLHSPYAYGGVRCCSVFSLFVLSLQMRDGEGERMPRMAWLLHMIHTLYINALIFNVHLLLLLVVVLLVVLLCATITSTLVLFGLGCFSKPKIKLLHQYNVVGGPVRNQNQTHTHTRSHM